MATSGDAAVTTINTDGASAFVLVCDHASNRLPAKYGGLGLGAEEMSSHIAWDPGALAVCRALSGLLDAPVIASNVSRLIIDCNRELSAPDLIRTFSETVPISANENLNAEERHYRITHFYQPFHDAIDALLGRRAGRETVLVCMHSFTPVYRGLARPWPIGIIHGADPRFSESLRRALEAAMPGLGIGWNEPYSAADGVTLTLERHGDARGLPATMIEIRNDGIADERGSAHWAGILARALTDAVREGGGHA